MPRRLPLAFAVLLLALVTPVAGASTASIKGQIVGNPYAADTKSAIPVLISKQTARRAGLNSPIGVIIVPRRALIATPEGGRLPGHLRLGDRFTATVVVDKVARRAVYGRLTATEVKVNKRAKQLSTAELAATVEELRRQLAGLTSYVQGLTAYTVAEFARVRADLASLRADLAALRGQLAGLQTQLDALSKQLAGVSATLQQQIDQLTVTVNGLLARLALAVPTVARLSDELKAITAGLSGLGGAALSSTLQQLGELQTGLAAVTGILAGTDAIVGTEDDPIAFLTGAAAAIDPQHPQVGEQVAFLAAAVNDPTRGLVGQVGTVQSTLASMCAIRIVTSC